VKGTGYGGTAFFWAGCAGEACVLAADLVSSTDVVLVVDASACAGLVGDEVTAVVVC
jgi:hypothetical protein